MDEDSLMLDAERDEAIHAALNIGPWSTAWERTVDITTTGAKTGLAHMVGVGAVCYVHTLQRD